MIASCLFARQFVFSVRTKTISWETGQSFPQMPDTQGVSLHGGMPPYE
jgi:hypothetical protein